jgi:predicted RNA-binding protein with PIN domain
VTESPGTPRAPGTSGASPEAPAPVPPPGLPDGLLAPLLDCAAEALRALDPDEVPAFARRLRAFDRRGLATPAARAQLRRALEAEEAFRAQVVARFSEREDSTDALAGWTAEGAPARVAAAAATGRLALLASALWAARPAGFEFGLGLVLAAFEAGRDQAGGEERARAAGARVAILEEALRRAVEARDAAVEQTNRLDAELREERRARRTRDQVAAEALDDARRLGDELEMALAEASRRLAEEESRARQAVDQAARAEARERAAEARAAAERLAPPPPPKPVSEFDRTRLVDAAEAAARLSATLKGILNDGGSPGPSSPSPRANPPKPPTMPAKSPAPRPGDGIRAGRERRATVLVPPGMRHDIPEAATAMMRTPGLLVVVDGYNVSMLAWPDAPPAEQRERLSGALAEFHLRFRCPVVVVFDGADVEGVRLPRRPGLSVVFSAEGQEADEVVVDEVAARPAAVPVIVVSSDGWVRARSEAEGAEVLSSALFLEVLGR